MSVPRRFQRYFPLLIVAGVLLVYANSFSAAFVLDDNRTVEENARLRHVLPRTPAEWVGPRAFADLTFAVNFAVAGLNPADYHAVNVLIHLAAALSLYGILSQGAKKTGGDGVQPGGTEFAFWCSLLWGVHPVTTAAVTYVSQRYEALASFFILLAIYALSRFCRCARSKRTMWAGVCGAACVLGVLSKEIALTAPILLLLFDRCILSASWKQTLKRRAGLHVAMVLLAWGTFALSVGVAAGEAGGRDLAAGVPPIVYLATEAGVILHYLRLIFDPRGLCLDYGWPVVESVGAAWPSLLIVGALAGGAVWMLWRQPAVAFWPCAFFVLLAPTSSVVARPDFAFDHRAYLASAAVIVSVGTAVRFAGVAAAERIRGGRVGTWRYVGRGLLAVLVVGCAVATRARNRVYASERLAWQDVVVKRPDNVRAWQNLAGLAVKRGDGNTAVAASREALKRLPDFSLPSVRARLWSSDSPDRRTALDAFAWANAVNTLGLVHLQREELAEAHAAFVAALEVTPGNPEAYANLATVLYEQGHRERAVEIWRGILENNPNDTVVRAALGRAARDSGDFGRARKQYEIVVSQRPNNLSAWVRLGWILAAAPVAEVRDAEGARACMQRIRALVPSLNAELLALAAAVCAESGDFEGAVNLQASALALAREGSAAEINVQQDRLELYSRRSRWLLPVRGGREGTLPGGSEEKREGIAP